MELLPPLAGCARAEYIYSTPDTTQSDNPRTLSPSESFHYGPASAQLAKDCLSHKDNLRKNHAQHHGCEHADQNDEISTSPAVYVHNQKSQSSTVCADEPGRDQDG